MNKKFAIAILAAAVGGFSLPASALDVPSKSRADSRIQRTVYKADDVVLVSVAPARTTTIFLSPSEKVLEMASGNSAAWEIIDRRNVIYIKPKTTADANTNLNVTTNLREYSFELELVENPKKSSYRVNMVYPGEAAKRRYAQAEKNFIKESLQAVPSIYAKNINSKYTMQQGKGSDGFKPLAAFDDGTFTYIGFANGQDMPNVFRVGEDGQESVINSTVQGDYLIVEGVYKTMMIRANNAVIGLYNENFKGGGKSTGTGTASPVVERTINGE